MNPKPQRVVVIGGSAGALEALFQLLPLFKKDLDFSLVVVLHRKGSDDGALEALLSIKTRLRVKEVEDKDILKEGTLHLAPGDYHLLFEKDGHLSLDFSEKVAYSRPSIDVAFASAAEAFGNKVIGVLLSGANNDGVSGLAMIREKGGMVLVQDPALAGMPVMPQAAINAGVVAQGIGLKELAVMLNSF